MSYQISLSQQAKEDLKEIYQYIAVSLQSPQNAAAQLSRLEKEIFSLQEMPERYRAYDHEKWKKRNLRVMTVDNYLVFYCPSRENEVVTVVRVLYGGSELDRQLHKSL